MLSLNCTMRMPPGLNAFCTPRATCCVVLISSASAAGSISKKLRAFARGTTSVWPSDCGIASMKATARSSSNTLNAGISPRRIFANTLLSSYISDPRSDTRFAQCVHDLADRMSERRVLGFELNRQCVEILDQGMPLARAGGLAEQPGDVAENGNELPTQLGIIRRPGASQLGVQGRELVLQFCSHCCHASTADEAAILCENESAVRSVVFLNCFRLLCGFLRLRRAGLGLGHAGRRGLLLARQTHVILLFELRNPGVVQALHAQDRRGGAEAETRIRHDDAVHAVTAQHA